jgi:ubiquinone/menaquinone biosynthesis C-methylase UbiE
VIDFSALAGRYDELRPAGAGWQEVADASLAMLGQPSRLLDVGCGTGRFTVLAAERLGVRAWGIDPSDEMLAQARRRPGAARVGWKLGEAEHLPFKDGWFDAAHAHLVLHVLRDRDAAYCELARVLQPGGAVALASFRPEHFTGFYLNRYFPSIPEIDGARFPDPATVAAGLTAVGFADVRLVGIDQPIAPEPADLLERVRGRYISTLHLVPDDEYARGLELLERELGEGVRPSGTLRWVLIGGRRT